MRHTLYNLVAVLCLLAFVVGSAACLTPTLEFSHGMVIHSMGAQDHACCTHRAPAKSTATNSCCTLHHQPASLTSAGDAPQTAMTALPPAGSLHVLATSLSITALIAVAPLRLPPLIALRI